VKLTNKYNLPQTLVNAVSRSTYTKEGANLSATELLSSPRITQLRRLNQEHLEEDVMDRVWSVFGSAVHHVLEQGKADNQIVEQRLHSELDGWTISGAIDLQTREPDGIIISDYKTTGVWAVMNEKREWEEQLNIYAWLVRRNSIMPVKRLEIVAILKDWNRREAETREGYPEREVKVINITLWSYEEQEEFVRHRIQKHADALYAAETNDDLPLCKPEEMWEKPTSYAIIKTGNVRAKKVCYSVAEANAELELAGKGFEIQVRPGERTRCANYCQVRDFCQQWKDYNGGKND